MARALCGSPFYQEDNLSVMRRHPNLFILGAPKCGTTSMARWLSEHPKVYFSVIKEPHYYSFDLANRVISSESRYESIFSGAKKSHSIIGEASTWYLYSKEAVPAIERANPTAQYIVMTRDPAAMAQSLYHHNCRVLHEDQDSFEKAWCLQGARASGRRIPASCTEPAFLQYKEACSLGSQLRRLYDHVASERILHLRLSDINLNPLREYQRVLDFLNVPYDGRERFSVENKARGHRSMMLQRLIRYGARMRLALGINRGFGFSRYNERQKEKVLISADFASALEDVFLEERETIDRIFNQYY